MISTQTRVVLELNRSSGINKKMINTMFMMVIKFTSCPMLTHRNTNYQGIPICMQVNKSKERIKTLKEKSIFQWIKRLGGSLFFANLK